MTTPQIKIIGTSGSGKSALAQVIKTALADHNIQCEITGCEDERPGVTKATWRERLATLSGKAVRIETIQARRGWHEGSKVMAATLCLEAVTQ